MQIDAISFDDGKSLILIGGLKAQLPIKGQRLLHILDNKAGCNVEKGRLIVL